MAQRFEPGELEDAPFRVIGPGARAAARPEAVLMERFRPELLSAYIATAEAGGGGGRGGR